MDQLKYREALWGRRRKVGWPKCLGCGKPINPAKVDEHRECVSLALVRLRAKAKGGAA